MFPEDKFCRAVLYPRFVVGGAFADEALLNFTKMDDGTCYALSLASRFLLGTDEGAHRYGRHAAEVANARFADRLGRAPSPPTEKVYYLGFYDLVCKDVHHLPMNHYSVSLKWRPENGIDEHFQIEFQQKNTGGTARERRSDRTAAIGILAKKMVGPQRAILDGDLDGFRAELEFVELPTRPASSASQGGEPPAGNVSAS